MRRKIIAIFVVLIMSLMPIGAFAADQNIAEIAIANGNFTTLVAALQKADLVGAVSGEGPLTVFAPTDAAFAKLLKQLNISANDLLNHPQLKEVLLFHVVSGKVMAKDLTNGMKAPTLNGESLMVDLTNGVKINGATVTTADIEASNGVIHVIDTVLVPANFKLAATAPVLPSTVPQTGDSSMVLYTLLMILSGTGILIANRKRLFEK